MKLNLLSTVLAQFSVMLPELSLSTALAGKTSHPGPNHIPSFPEVDIELLELSMKF